VYCLGHAALACIDLPSPALQATLDPRSWLMAGLFLIACGSGGIKPCVSAHVGDQFCRRNGHLMSRVFGWFYFSINFGSFFSTLLTPWLLKHHGPGWAFGVPGVLMAIATFVFWLGRHRYAHIPAQGFAFLREAAAPEGRSAILRLVMVYAFVAVFWSLYDQTGSAWVLQASQMDCTFLGFQWLESQVQAVNPLLILVYVPLFAYVVYPAMGKVITLTPLRKIGMGFALTVAAFAISAHAQRLIDDEQAAFRAKVAPIVAAEGMDLAKTAEALRAVERNAAAAELEALLTVAAGTERDAKVADTLALGGIAVTKEGSRLEADWPSIAWQLLAYLVLTAAEVMVSITGLEFSYTQAPASMKSIVMSLWLLSVSAGNVLTALVNRFTQDADGNSTLVGASYYWFFTALMLGATLVFMVVSRFYRYRDVLPATGHPEAPNA
jgi:dipeptide/tripeptide permease